MRNAVDAIQDRIGTPDQLPDANTHGLTRRTKGSSFDIRVDVATGAAAPKLTQYCARGEAHCGILGY
ncbi:hypothetical protein GCM10007385_25570 [Tateyamaria omphalii]|nr:hypothetical protein GCM10007385_25570 [Tateyamaria omphalii]